MEKRRKYFGKLFKLRNWAWEGLQVLQNIAHDWLYFLSVFAGTWDDDHQVCVHVQQADGEVEQLRHGGRQEPRRQEA